MNNALSYCLYTYLFSLCLGMSVAAQQTYAPRTAANLQATTRYLTQRKATLHHLPNLLPGGLASAEAIAQAIRAHLPNLNSDPRIDLQLVQQIESPMGSHYSFVQTYSGIPIYQATIRASINRKGQISLLSDRTFNTTLADIRPLSAQFREEAATAIAQFLTQHQLIIQQSPAARRSPADAIRLLFTNDQQAKWVYRVAAESPDHKTYTEYLIDEQGNQVFQRDLTNDAKAVGSPQKTPHNAKEANAPCYEAAEPQNYSTFAREGSEISAYIFNPDPLTTAQKQYGATGMIDNNDTDTPQLTAQRQQVTITATQDEANGIWHLENEQVKIVEYESPAAAPATSNSPSFDFTRSQSGFEDVNAFYHATTQMNYVASLGFDMMNGKQVWIDTHAEQGDDQSRHRYDFNFDKHIITHGEGGVDDAEDADVVIHELGHALSYAACPDCNDGDERSALDEALCDYFAAAYSKGLSNFKWKKVFSWDGHNPFFEGRNTDNNAHYPEDVSDESIYATSLIFSGALSDILDEIGRPATDSLVLACLYKWSAGIGLDDAAYIAILTDEELTGGKYYDKLCYVFNQRGLFEGACAITADAGPDREICLGDTTTLGASVLPPIGGKIVWTPNEGLSSDTVAYPICSPNRTTTYLLTLKNDNITLTDSVTVTLKYCFDNPIGDEIKVYNTNRFATGGDIIVEVPTQTQQTTVQLFDMNGRQLRRIEHSGEERLLIDGANLAKGAYVLQIEADGKKARFKLVKTQ